MNILPRIWQDIRKGENIDLYLTIMVAISMALLNIIGLASQTVLTSVTLAVLGLLAITSLGNRYRVERLSNKLSPQQESFFLEAFPAKLQADFEAADELWLVGVTLSRTIKTNYSLIEKKLQQGHRIRVLLVHPEGVGIEMAVSRNYARRDVMMKSNDVRNTLKYLSDLKQVAPDKLEVRTIQNLLDYGAIAVNPNTINGILYLENYPFRVVSHSLPKFVLSVRDGRWYEMYKQEMEHLWQDGIEWNDLLNK